MTRDTIRDQHSFRRMRACRLGQRYLKQAREGHIRQPRQRRVRPFRLQQKLFQGGPELVRKPPRRQPRRPDQARFLHARQCTKANKKGPVKKEKLCWTRRKQGGSNKQVCACTLVRKRNTGLDNNLEDLDLHHTTKIPWYWCERQRRHRRTEKNQDTTLLAIPVCMNGKPRT